jgi:signal transduction histidine kinase
LATVQGYLEGIADHVVAADAETLDALRAETRRMARLAEDLAKVSRAEERQLGLRPLEVEPALLVRSAVQGMAAAYAAEGVALETDVEERVPAVRVDIERMGEVLGNLLENALRHTERGGRVTISAARRGPELELAVADSGEGIAREHLERVFERFYRIDPARSRAHGGSGIGLAIARAIVEAHGGEIHAESAGVGHGTRFIVRLPVAGRSEAVASPPR